MLTTTKPDAFIALTMTSREIEQLTGKDLSHIHRDARAMLDELAGTDDPDLDHVREDKDSRGYTTCFHLPKSLTITLMAGYSVKMRHAIVKRWQELEAKQAAPAFTLPDFTNPAAAARAWADAIEATQALAIERDHAIATKAQIGSRREATAMGTASAACKESAKLRALMGEATKSASILAVQGKTGIPYSWRNLKNYCTAAGLRMGKSFNPGLQLTVNTYPAEAWFEVYGVDLVELFSTEVQQ